MIGLVPGACARCRGQLFCDAPSAYDPYPEIKCLQCGRTHEAAVPFKKRDAHTGRKRLVAV